MRLTSSYIFLCISFYSALNSTDQTVKEKLKFFRNGYWYENRLHWYWSWLYKWICSAIAWIWIQLWPWKVNIIKFIISFWSKSLYFKMVKLRSFGDECWWRNMLVTIFRYWWYSLIDTQGRHQYPCTIFWCWWQNLDFGDIFWMLMLNANIKW